MTDLRRLHDALASHAPAHDIYRLLDPQTVRDCTDCHHPFTTGLACDGSKWTSLCPSCLSEHL